MVDIGTYSAIIVLGASAIGAVLFIRKKCKKEVIVYGEECFKSDSADDGTSTAEPEPSPRDNELRDERADEGSRDEVDEIAWDPNSDESEPYEFK